jgi:hypothetical protein
VPPRSCAGFQQIGGLGHTALHWAAVRGCTAAVDWLLSRGLAADARNKVGSTPLHAAAANDRVDVSARRARALGSRARALLGCAPAVCAHTRLSTRPRGRLARAHALRHASPPRSVSRALTHSATPRRLAPSAPPAVARARAQVVALLLERGADDSLLDSSGETALAKARERKFAQVCALLEKRGAGAAAAGSSAQHAAALPSAASSAASHGAAIFKLIEALDAELAAVAATMPAAEGRKLGSARALVASARVEASGAREALGMLIAHAAASGGRSA